jgi:hypothetical protein
MAACAAKEKKLSICVFQFPPDKAQTSPDCSGAVFGKRMEPVHFRIMFKVRDPPATSGGDKN